MKAKGSTTRAPRRLVAVGVLSAFMAVTAMGAAPASASITWGPNTLGQADNDRYYWTDASKAWTSTTGISPGISPAFVGLTVSDFDALQGGYPWPYCTPKPECPYRVGTFSQVSQDNAVSWTPKVRLNSEDWNGARPAMASDESNLGQSIGAAFVSQSSYYDSNVGSGPRALYFVYNGNYGKESAWGLPATRITSNNGQVDSPSLDYSNGTAFLSWTDSKSGKVMLATSDDQGATWSKQTIGTTTHTEGGYPYGPGGFGGRPAVAVTNDGMTIGIAYLSTASGKIRCAVSTDGGATWATKTLQRKNGNPLPRANNVPTASGVAGRIGFSWTDGVHVFAREFDAVSQTWGARITAATMPINGTNSVDSTGITLNGASQTAIAFGGCITEGCPIWGGTRMGTDLLYTESGDQGATWSAPDTVAVHDDGAVQFWNDEGQVIFTDSATRYIRYYQQSKNAFLYETRVIKGVGN